MRGDIFTPENEDKAINTHDATENSEHNNNQEVTIPDALSVEERTTPDGNTITVIKRTTQTELIVPIRNPKTGEAKDTARVILQPWATDIRNAPKHVQDDFMQGVFNSFMRFRTELEKDPV